MKATLNVYVTSATIEASDHVGLRKKKEALEAAMIQAGCERVCITFGQIFDEEGSPHVLVPTTFGMFTQAGNNLLVRRATKLVKDLKQSPDKGRKHVLAYFKSYAKLCDCDASKHTEISDTDVREQVWDFAIKAVAPFRILNWDEMDQLWNQRHK